MLSSTFSFGQKKSRFKGTYKPGTQVNGNSSGKKYKYLGKKNKKTKLQVRKRNKTAEKRRRAKIKHRKKNRKKLKRGKKSLYSSNAKKRKKKYPKNKKALLPKVTAIVSVSPIITDKKEVLNEQGKLENLFSQSKVGPAINLGLVYNVTSNVSLGGEVTGGLFGKENYNFSLTGLRLLGYYKFGDPVRNKFLPYIRLSAEHTYFNINQESYTEQLNPTNSTDDETQAEVTSVLLRNPEINVSRVPFIGLGVGVGASYKLNRKIDVFVMPCFTLYNTYDKERLMTFFPTIKSDFSVFRVNFGLNVNLFSSKSLF